MQYIFSSQEIQLNDEEFKLIENIFISSDSYLNSELRKEALRLISKNKKKFLELFEFWIRDFEHCDEIILYAIKKRRIILKIKQLYNSDYEKEKNRFIYDKKYKY